jgi:hypothetical protein
MAAEGTVGAPILVSPVFSFVYVFFVLLACFMAKQTVRSIYDRARTTVFDIKCELILRTFDQHIAALVYFLYLCTFLAFLAKKGTNNL